MEIDEKKIDDDFIKEIEDFKPPSSIIISTELFIFTIYCIIFTFVILIIFIFYIGFKRPEGIEDSILEEKTFVTTKFKFTRSIFPLMW